MLLSPVLGVRLFLPFLLQVRTRDSPFESGQRLRESERRFLREAPPDRVVLPSSRLDSTRTVSSARAVQIRGGSAVKIEW